MRALREGIDTATPMGAIHEPGKFTVVETYDTNENYGFAASKTNTSLITAVNKELTAINANGDYKAIYDKYFAVK